MIYFYYGEDTFSARDTVMQLKRKFIQTYDPSGNNVETIDQDEFSLERFFNAVKSSGFLATKKFIIIRNIFSYKKFADSQDVVIEFLKTQKNTKDENYLIFWQEGMPKQNTKLFKALKKITEPPKQGKEFKKLSASELGAWIQRHAARYSKTIDHATADVLIATVGDNLWNLHHEIQKLCHVSTQPAISVEDITALIATTRGEVIFTLMDAIGSKKKSDALRLLESYFRHETDRQFLVTMIIRQYRLIYLAKEAGTETNNSYAVAERLKLHPFVAKKMLEQSARYSPKELQRIYGNLVSLDSILKSDPEKLEAALTLFITQL